ncbi:hypothetical protein ACJJID_02460 [Microbulbifer sp. CnH-101-G]|uniref:hypothetical protein n=1 Tax=Microbulbifer sp. CnH-101-G TaxID=3243393 RepID=UPI00403971C5
MGFLETIIAGLIVAGVSGAVGWAGSKIVFRRKIEALPKKWVDQIAALIQEALSEGSDRCIINAKAIVASRDAMRKSLITLNDSLNSEVDKLAELLGNKIERAERWEQGQENKINVDEVWQQIQVLDKYWRMKSDEIESGIRKVLSELGVDKI